MFGIKKLKVCPNKDISMTLPVLVLYGVPYYIEEIYQRQISKPGLAEVMEAGGGSGQTNVKFSSELKVYVHVHVANIVCSTCARMYYTYMHMHR